MGGPLADTDHVIGHELVHAFQFDITTRPELAARAERRRGDCRCGSSKGWRSTCRSGRSIRTRRCGCATRCAQNKLPSIKDLDNPKYFPYRWGQAFWAYVGGRFGDDVIPHMLRLAAAAGEPDARDRRKYSASKTKQLSDDWHEAMRAPYEPVLAAAMPPSGDRAAGGEGRPTWRRCERRPGTQPRRSAARVSLDAQLSFRPICSSRTPTTGKVLHQLTSTRNRSAFLQHAVHLLRRRMGCCERAHRGRDGRQRKVRRSAIFNARSGETKRAKCPLATVDEIFNPTWAPDAHAVCFTGMAAV